MLPGIISITINQIPKTNIMKNKILITFLALAFNSSLFAQTIYKSNVCSVGCVSIELTTVGSTVYATRTSITCNTSLKSSLYNLAGFTTEDNNTFRQPAEGRYWIIPFTDGTAHLIGGGSFCINCTCSGSAGQGYGYCSVGNSMGTWYCADVTCGGCCTMEWWEGDCGGSTYKVVGGGIIVKADRVVIN